MGAGIFHRLRYLRGLCHDLRADLPCHRADGDRKRDPGQYLAVCDLRWACSSTF